LHTEGGIITFAKENTDVQFSALVQKLPSLANVATGTQARSRECQRQSDL